MITSFELAIKSLILEKNLLLFQSLKMRYSDITPENFISAGNKLFDDYWMYLTIDSGEIHRGIQEFILMDIGDTINPILGLLIILKIGLLKIP